MPARPSALASALALALAVLAAPAATAEEVVHPVYQSWAKYKPGTTITVRQRTNSGSKGVVTTTTTTLIELNDQGAVLETVMVSDANGAMEKTPPDRYLQRKMFPLFPGVKKEDIGKPPGAAKQGRETITVLGKEYDAVWFESKGQTEAGPSSTKTWMSDEVPGRVLKAVTEVPATRKRVEIELVEFKTP